MSNYLDMINQIDKLPIFNDIDTLNIYVEYLLNDNNKHINHTNILNLKDYIDAIDDKVLISNDTKMARFNFIKYYLEAKVECGLASRPLCINYVMDNVNKKHQGIIRREILDTIEPGKLDKKDIEFINGMVFAHLNVIFLHRYKVGMVKIIEDLDTNKLGTKPEDMDNLIQFFQSLVGNLSQAQRRSKQDNRFNLSDEILFKSVIKEACDRLLSNSQFLKTGWQGLNTMLNGGIETSRVYNFVGATGGFKSGLLLNIMKGVKRYNVGREHKDPNKRQTVLFISQENNLWETILRIFGIFASTDNIKNYTVSEIIDMLKKGGFSVVSGSDEIDIEFRYYGNEDIGVPDIKGIIEELDNDGREVICIIQDYVERLKPPSRKVDRRLQLADITNQMHDLAVEMEVPIITASQFNRDGVAIIEEMQAANKTNIAKAVGTKNVSESFGMLKNIDVNISIVVEYDSDEERFYLSFSKLKFRGADDNTLDYFLQPFAGINSKIQLMEDVILDKPLYRMTLGDTKAAELEVISKKMNKSIRTRKVIDIDLNQDEMSSNNDFLKHLDEEISKKSDKNKYCRDHDGYIMMTPIINTAYVM